ncbi:MAG TPA: (2Fe-2S)-binding protein [Byssovorax sp.]|jgi:bacterioferritin-associated ferredoxin
MYVCLCRGVTERDILRAIDAGACSTSEVMRCTRAGTCCGTCVPTVAAMVDESATDASAPRSSRRLCEFADEPALATG